MKLDNGFFRFYGQFFLYRHVEDNIAVSRINFLSGNKTVKSRVFGNCSAVCREKDLNHGEMRNITAPFGVDIALDFRYIECIGKHGMCTVAIGHDINADVCNGTQGTDPSAVRPISPHAVILPVFVLFHGKNKQDKTGAHQQRREHLGCFCNALDNSEQCSTGEYSSDAGFFAEFPGSKSRVQNGYAGIKNKKTGFLTWRRKRKQQQNL